MKNNLDLIITATTHWDAEYSSPAFSLAKEFAKNNRVFFFDYPITLFDVFKRFRSKFIRSRLGALFFAHRPFTNIAGHNDRLVAITVPVVLPINWLPKGGIYRFFLGVNNYIFFTAVKRALRKYGVKEFVYFNSYNPFYGRKLPSWFKPKRFVYQSIDDISESTYVSKHGIDLEFEAIRNSDLALATSTELTRILSKDKEVYLLPNAFDDRVFASNTDHVRPSELKDISVPIIGYTGNIYIRLNYDILYKVALQNEDKILLMVGPRNDKGQHEYDFDSLPNVIFTGSKDITELPAYLAHIDCAVIPFKKNKLTKSIYPLKINEYLAMGKAVVTTNFSRDIKGFGDFIYLSDSDEEFIQNIDRAIEENTEEKILARKKKASESTWKVRVDEFWNYLEQHTNLN